MKLLRSFLVASLLCPLGGLMISGCAVDAGVDEDDTGEAASAIGESTCGTTSLDMSDIDDDPWGCGDSSATYTSPSATYGHADCTKAYIVGFENVNSGVGVVAFYNDTLPTTQSTCTSSGVLIYTYDTNGNLIAHTQTNGVWSNNHCTIGGAEVGIYNWTPGANNTMNRAVVEAFTCSGFHCSTRTTHKVGVWAYFPPC